MTLVEEFPEIQNIAVMADPKAPGGVRYVVHTTLNIDTTDPDERTTIEAICDRIRKGLATSPTPVSVTFERA